MTPFLRLVRDEGGASLVEMGLMMPLLATMVFAMGDLSRAYSTKLQLEQAAYRAIEKVQQYQSTESTYTLLKNEAVSAANDAGFTDVTASNVTVTYWLECDGVKQSSYDAVCPSSGAKYARWIQVDVKETFTPTFTPVGFNRWMGSNADGTFTLHGKSGLRTQ